MGRENMQPGFQISIKIRPRICEETQAEDMSKRAITTFFLLHGDGTARHGDG